MYCLWITSNGSNGLYLDYDATDSELSNMLISQHGGTGDGGLVCDADNCRVSNIHLWGNYYNVILAPAHNVTGLNFENMGFMDNINHNVYKGSSYIFKNSFFTGCHFWGKLSSGSTVRDCFYVSSSGSMRCITVSGSVFRGENEAGTHQGRYAVNWGTNVTYCVFACNTIEGFTQAAGYSITGTNNEVAHNTVYDCG